MRDGERIIEREEGGILICALISLLLTKLGLLVVSGAADQTDGASNFGLPYCPLQPGK